MKVTLATLKSFIRKNSTEILIQNLSSFNGQIDGIESSKDQNFYMAQFVKLNSHNLGIKGVYMVGHSDDYITTIENDEYVGFHIDNCCGSFSLVIKKKKRK